MALLDSILAKGFIPYAFGWGENLDRLRPLPLGVEPRRISAEAPRQLPFHLALNRLNQHAFGGPGLGMPPWVQLDCCVLPSAFLGFARLAAELPDTLRAVLDPAAADGDLLPVSESIVVPTVDPATWMSFSLATAWPGEGLALASKALSLAAWGVRRALGVAQYDNRALRTHTRFGPLRLIDPQVSYHSRADRSFLYAIDDVPAALAALDDPPPPEEPDRWLDPTDTASITQMATARRDGSMEHWILPPGLALRGDRSMCPIREAPALRRGGGPAR